MYRHTERERRERARERERGAIISLYVIIKVGLFNPSFVYDRNAASSNQIIVLSA